MKLQDRIDALEDAQDKLREAVELIRNAMKGHGDYQRARRYIIGNLEPLIDSDHHWLCRSPSVQDQIDCLTDELNGTGEFADDEEENENDS